MNLVVDIGNSRTKAAIFSGGEIIERWYSEDPDTEELNAILTKYPDIHSSILSSTRDERHPTENILARNTDLFIRFDPSIPIPIKNSYLTPHTLGADRLAAAIGAYSLYPGRNVMVADFGTALTVDVVTAAGEYTGGNISPGASMRFMALNSHTDRLPLLKFADKMTDLAYGRHEQPLLGRSTPEAIEAGVVNGMIFELEGYIGRLEDRFDDLVLIFTGGEAKFFVNKLKNTIFANYDLVLIGLNTILEYNADRK